MPGFEGAAGPSIFAVGETVRRDPGKKSETKKVGGIRRLLLGADGKFGGARGAIDFLPGSFLLGRDLPGKKSTKWEAA